MTRFSARYGVMAACLLAFGSAAHARDRAATITILDGQASLIHAAARMAAAEGVAIEAEDILETAPGASLLRLELDGGATLDLGPATRVMVRPPLGGAGANGAAPVAYVLEGWAKLTVASTSQSGKAVMASALMDVTALERDLVLHVKGAEAELFAESGKVQTLVASKTGAPAPTNVDKGAFLARRADGAVGVTPRPAPAFIQAVPRAFMDTLPSRLAMFKGKDIKLNPAGRMTYEDTQAWLNAEPRMRTLFLTRWKPLAQDEAFRRSLVGQMAQHPEWHKVLFPAPAAASSTGQSARKPVSNPVTSAEAVKP
ncbi:MAG: hypothetical protein EPO09_01480 [Aquabacterium sp.]|uniref:hypothetical protein n=1 Tax=Aquabacterium sp. TaxID=1872578 RepID=UPI001227D0F7|nr:hypothetical protein [Aquabacterium sp.]TAK99222.1 MAG: hypothetical protein EPO09_01480 [Aquabacterium sp.]